MKKHEYRARRVVLRLMALGLLVAFSFPILRAVPSLGAAVNPFDVFLQRLAIQTKAGSPTTIDRKWSSQTFPLSFTISGQLPQGQIECFAFLITVDAKTYQSQRCTDNPFKPQDKWTDDFFEFRQGDRLVAYNKTNLTGKTLRITAFGKIPKTLGVNQIVFAVAPLGAVGQSLFHQAHIVIVNYVK